MKITEYCGMVARLDGLTTYHYKVLFLLMQKSMTQSQMSEELGVMRQNMNKVCKELESMNLITTERTEGRNRFLGINKNMKDVGVKGQLKFE